MTQTEIDERDPTLGSSEPGRCWTFINMSEATPEVLTPMCWSIWTPLGELSARGAWYQLGLLPRSDVRLPTDPNEYALGVFYGRQALNVDRLATMMGALPGASREIVERSMLGTVRDSAPPDVAPAGRLPFVLTRAPVMFAAQGVRARRCYAEQLAWWQRDVLDGAETDGQALLAAARDRFVHAMIVHGHSRFQSQAVIGAIEKLAVDAGVGELVTAACSAFGQVSETGIAADLWELSRRRLSEQEFLRRHGFHGGAEGNVTGVSWRVDAAPIRSVTRAMAARADSEHPLRRVAAAAEARTAAVRAIRAALPGSRRPLLSALLRLAASRTRCQEQTKAAFTMAIDGCRAAVAILGPRLAEAGCLDSASDAVFLTLDEHLAGPTPASAGLAAFRRTRREAYHAMTLPTTFVGMPAPLAEAPPPATTGVASRMTDGSAVGVPDGGAGPGPGPNGGSDGLTTGSGTAGPGTVSGVAGSAGIVEGPARVILDLEHAGDLEPGEILVCRHTDPAWVAAMALAEALVIDLGAPASHGAIVARELGIPCVIGTATGTRVIRTGDHIRVDGTRGLVEVLHRCCD